MQQQRTVAEPQYSDSDLDAIINLLHNVLPTVCGPIAARLRHYRWDFHVVRDGVWILEDHPGHTGAQMPGDVAVEWPDSRVVLEPLDHDIRAGHKHMYVTTLRVL